MSIKLYNTLSGGKEEFKPIIDGNVGIYSCGPTVYDYAHIGNLRAYVFSDVLRKALEYNGYEVKHVMNITDIGHLTSDSDEGEDKMTKGLRREGKPITMEAMKELALFYEEKFKENLAELNIEMPATMPRASEHIKEDIELIKVLEEKGITYKTSDGVYFDISKFEDYGKLGKIDLKSLKEGARVGVNAEKRNAGDFALWKFNDKLGWASPWGQGFPGWHIECSAMATKYLGQPFDIHTGGIDLIPTHHQNEIAQSESAYDKPLANYWMHGAFLNIGNERMAKSAGNFTTLATIKEKGYSPLAYRFLLLNSHYRSPSAFTWEAMDGAKNGLEGLKGKVESLGSSASKLVNQDFKAKFLEKINDDLNTPQALAVVYELLKSDLSNGEKLTTVLDFDKILGLNLGQETAEPEIPEEIKQLADERRKAREEKEWKRADELREKIEKLGFVVEDVSLGYRILPR